MPPSPSIAGPTTLPPPPPRKVRGSWLPGPGWVDKVCCLPHLLIAVGMTSWVVAAAACALFGTDSPGRVVGGRVEQHTSAATYTLYVDVDFDRDGRTLRKERTVDRSDYERYIATAAATPAVELDNRVTAPVEAPALAPAPAPPPIRMRHVGIGPWHYAEVLLPQERPFEGKTCWVLWVLWWDALMTGVFYQVYVKPYRQHRLYRLGVTSMGRITAKRKESTGYYIDYAFEADGATPVTAELEVPQHLWDKATVGEEVTVLHYPGRARPSSVYEYGPHEAIGAAPGTVGAAEAPPPAAAAVPQH